MNYKIIAAALLLIAGKVAVYGQYSATWKQLGEYARADSMLVQKGPDALMLSKAYGYIVGTFMATKGEPLPERRGHVRQRAG